MTGLLQDHGCTTTKIGLLGYIPKISGPTLLPSTFPMASRTCEYCQSASALLYCNVDSAFLCMGCDAKIHRSITNKIMRHEKVWICEVCEQAPASFTCKADAASLCITCDHDIHSANPLARRHEKVPVVPFHDTAEAVVKTTASIHLGPVSDTVGTKQVSFLGHGNYGDACVFAPETPDLKSVEFLLSQSDQLQEFDYPISATVNHDSVVPVQTMDLSPPPKFVENLSKNHFEIDFTKSNIISFKNSFTTPSPMHSVSASSMDVGLVPDGSSISETSYSFGTTIPGGKVGNCQSAQVLRMDREARVLRYRERRKNRKFEKTKRYASRKAYAEKRPRIKGRFVKRTEVDIDGEIDQVLGTSSRFSITGSTFKGCTTPFGSQNSIDSRYCVVPTSQ